MYTYRKAAAALVPLLALMPLQGAAVLASAAPAGSNVPAPYWTDAAKMYDNPYMEESGRGVLSAEALANWWTLFNDDALNELIELSLKNNRDLEIARHRMNESRAALGISKAERLPWMNVSGRWARSNAIEKMEDKLLPRKIPGVELPNEVSQLGLDASWEIDMFGKQKAKVREAAHTAAAAEGALYGTWVSLTAEVALHYMSFRTLEEELAIAEDSASSQEEQLSLIQTNRKAGLASILPEEQAAARWKQTKAQIPDIKKAMAQEANQLSVLTGTVPGEIDKILKTTHSSPMVDARLYNAIPAEKLRQRPDIYAAEQNWMAQMAKTEAAKAALKPKFSILGLLGLATAGTGGLFSAGSRMFGIMPSVSMPIFNGGALRKNVKLQSEKEKEMQASYENQVLKAAAEVRSAMAAVAQDAERKENLNDSMAHAKEARDTSQNLYDSGLSDYINVLDSERNYLAARQSYCMARGQEMADLIRLFKSLGGGWGPLDETYRDGKGAEK